MRKIIYFVSIVALMSCGCVYKNHNHYENVSTNTANMSSADFNDEIYVWENLNFSTNRIDKVGK